MTYLLKRGLFLGAIFMFGFILGIVYTNNAGGDEENLVGFTLYSPQSEEKQNEENDSSTYQGFRWKDSNELKIDMEDEDKVVIYDEEGSNREDFIQPADLHRDLLDKQNYVIETKNNLFSEMG